MSPPTSEQVVVGFKIYHSIRKFQMKVKVCRVMLLQQKYLNEIVKYEEYSKYFVYSVDETDVGAPCVPYL